MRPRTPAARSRVRHDEGEQERRQNNQAPRPARVAFNVFGGEARATNGEARNEQGQDAPVAHEEQDAQQQLVGRLHGRVQAQLRDRNVDVQAVHQLLDEENSRSTQRCAAALFTALSELIGSPAAKDTANSVLLFVYMIGRLHSFRRSCQDKAQLDSNVHSLSACLEKQIANMKHPLARTVVDDNGQLTEAAAEMQRCWEKLDTKNQNPFVALARHAGTVLCHASARPFLQLSLMALCFGCATRGSGEANAHRWKPLIKAIGRVQWMPEDPLPDRALVRFCSTWNGVVKEAPERMRGVEPAAVVAAVKKFRKTKRVLLTDVWAAAAVLGEAVPPADVVSSCLGKEGSRSLQLALQDGKDAIRAIMRAVQADGLGADSPLAQTTPDILLALLRHTSASTLRAIRHFLRETFGEVVPECQTVLQSRFVEAAVRHLRDLSLDISGLCELCKGQDLARVERELASTLASDFLSAGSLFEPCKRADLVDDFVAMVNACDQEVVGEMLKSVEGQFLSCCNKASLENLSANLLLLCARAPAFAISAYRPRTPVVVHADHDKRLAVLRAVVQCAAQCHRGEYAALVVGLLVDARVQLVASARPQRALSLAHGLAVDVQAVIESGEATLRLQCCLLNGFAAALVECCRTVHELASVVRSDADRKMLTAACAKHRTNAEFLPAVQALLDVAHAHVQDVRNGNYTQEQALAWMGAEQELLRETFQILGFEAEAEVDLKDLKHLFDQVEHRRAVLGYLESRGVGAVAQLCNDMQALLREGWQSRTTRRQLEKAVARFASEDDKGAMDVLLRACDTRGRVRSRVFRGVLRREFDRCGDDLQSTVRWKLGVERATAAAKAFVSRLLERKISMQELVRLHKELSSADTTAEVALLSELLLGPPEAQGGVDVQEVVEWLRSAQYVVALPSLLSVVSALRLVDEQGDDDLEFLRMANRRAHGAAGGSTGQDDLQRVGELFEGITHTHLGLLAALAGRARIVEFFREGQYYTVEGRRRFDQLKHNVTMAVGADPFYNDVLSAAIQAHKFLEPFARPDDQPTTLAGFLHDLSGIPRLREADVRFVEYANKHAATLGMLFSDQTESTQVNVETRVEALQRSGVMHVSLKAMARGKCGWRLSYAARGPEEAEGEGGGGEREDMDGREAEGGEEGGTGGQGVGEGGGENEEDEEGGKEGDRRQAEEEENEEETEEGRVVMDEHAISEFRLQLSFYGGNNEQHRGAVSQCSRLVEEMQALANSLFELERLGHPEFQNTVEAVKCSAAAVQSRAKAVAAEKKEWLRQLDQCRNDFPLLAMLTNTDVANLLELVDPAARNKVDVVCSLASDVLQEERGSPGWDEALEAMTLRCIRTYMDLLRQYADVRPDAQDVQGHAQLARPLDRLAMSVRGKGPCGVPHLVELLCEVFCPPKGRESVRKGQLHSHSLLDEEGQQGPPGLLLRALLDIHTDAGRSGGDDFLPRDACELWCNESTSEHDLRLFFQRARLFKGLRFVLVGVDRLSLAEHDVVLEEQKRLRKLNGKHGDVHLVSLAGASDGQPLPDDRPDSGTCVRGLGAQMQVVHQRLVQARVARPAVIAVCGGPSSGKSHYLRNMLGTARNVSMASTAISLNDTVDFGRVVRTLACLPDNALVSFNVSAHAPLDHVNRLFYQLLVVGAVRDERSGAVFALPPTCHRWTIYVEVPYAAKSDERHSARALSFDVRNTAVLLPIVKLVAKKEHVVKWQEPWQADSVLREVGKCLRSYLSVGKLPPHSRQIDARTSERKVREVMQKRAQGATPPPWPQFPPVSGEDAQKALAEAMEEFGVVLESKLHKQLFIRLLASRFAVFNSELFHLDTTPKLGSTLLEQFVAEAAHLSAPGLECSLKEWKQPLLLRHPQGLSFFRLHSPHHPVGEQVEGLTKGGEEDLQTRHGVCKAAILGEKLAGVLGTTPEAVKGVLTRYEFVMTEEMAFKMVVFHERRLAMLPLVVEGETGVGKSFPIEVYCALVNEAVQQDRSCPDSPNLANKAYAWIRSNVVPPKDGENEQQQQQLRRWSLLSNAQEKEPEKRQECLTHEFVEWDKCPEMGEWVRQQVDEGGMIETRVLVVWDKVLGLCPDALPDVEDQHPVRALRSWVRQLFATSPLLPDRIPDAVAEHLEGEPTRLSSNQLMQAVMETPLRPLYHRLMVHPGIDDAAVEEFMAGPLALAERLERRGSRLVQIVFFDEMNTATCLGLLKEMLVDRTMNGRKLPESLFVCAAINPAREREAAQGQAQEQGVQVTTRFYHVRALPRALRDLRVRFAPLTPDACREYVMRRLELHDEANVDGTNGGRLNANLKNKFADFLVRAHLFFEQFTDTQGNAVFDEGAVSQREFERVFKLFPFFWNLAPIPERQNNTDELTLRCMYAAVALVYFFRLPLVRMPNDRRDIGAQSLRHAFVEWVRPDAPTFEGDVNSVVDGLVTEENFVLPRGVALNQALKENLFAIVACTQTRVPLGIIGVPGSSKSLSYRIAETNLQGQSSPTEFCRQFLKLQTIFYQCSRFTTAGDIDATFRKTIARQRLDTDTVCCVFLDEAGLPPAGKHALKALHAFLDEREVAFVCISNEMFDPANANRMAKVLRCVATEEDLEVLALGCIGADMGRATPRLRCVVRGICKGYRRLVAHERFSKVFHYRELVHLFRHLMRCTGTRLSGHIAITPRALLAALEENFNGVSPDEFGEVLGIFFRAVREELRKQRAVLADAGGPDGDGVGGDEAFEIPGAGYHRTAAEVLNDTLRGGRVGLGDPLAPRFKLVVAPTHGADAVRLLQDCGMLPRDRCRVFCLGEPDRSDLRAAEMISQVALSLEAPGHTVLVNAEPIHHALYDLYNLSFRESVQQEGDDHAGLCTNVAIGDRTFPKTVHSGASVLVVVTQEEFDNAPSPFLSRFAKFRLHLDQFVDLRVRRVRDAGLRNDVRSALDKCRLFVAHLGPSAFHGAPTDARSNDTLASLFLSHLVTTDDQGESVGFAECTAMSANALAHCKADTRPERLVKMMCCRLLQLVAPEYLVLRLRDLGNDPRFYARAYFAGDVQEHFDLCAFVGALCRSDPRCAGKAEAGSLSLSATSNHALARKFLVFAREGGALEDALGRLEESDKVEVRDCHRLEARRDMEGVLDGFAAASNQVRQQQQQQQGHDEQPLPRVLVLRVGARDKTDTALLCQLVDTRQEALRAHFVVVLVHFPADMYEQPAHHPMLLGGWDTLFVDPGHGAAALHLRKLGKGGEGGREGDDDDMACGERREVLRSFCSSLRLPKLSAQTLERLDPVARAFYQHHSSVDARLGALEAVLDRHPKVFRRLLRLFSSTFTVQHVLGLACHVATELVLRNERTGFASLLERHCRTQLLASVGHSLGEVVDDFGLHTLALVGGEEELDDDALALVGAPSAVDLRSANKREHAVRFPSGVPMQTPLFHLVHKRVQARVLEARDPTAPAIHARLRQDRSLHFLTRLGPEAAPMQRLVCDLVMVACASDDADHPHTRTAVDVAAEYLGLEFGGNGHDDANAGGEEGTVCFLAHVYAEVRRSESSNAVQSVFAAASALCALAQGNLGSDVAAATAREQFRQLLLERLYDRAWERLQEIASVQCEAGGEGEGQSAGLYLQWVKAFRAVRVVFDEHGDMLDPREANKHDARMQAMDLVRDCLWVPGVREDSARARAVVTGLSELCSSSSSSSSSSAVHHGEFGGSFLASKLHALSALHEVLGDGLGTVVRAVLLTDGPRAASVQREDVELVAALVNGSVFRNIRLPEHALASAFEGCVERFRVNRRHSCCGGGGDEDGEEKRRDEEGEERVVAGVVDKELQREKRLEVAESEPVPVFYTRGHPMCGQQHPVLDSPLARAYVGWKLARVVQHGDASRLLASETTRLDRHDLRPSAVLDKAATVHALTQKLMDGVESVEQLKEQLRTHSVLESCVQPGRVLHEDTEGGYHLKRFLHHLVREWGHGAVYTALAECAQGSEWARRVRDQLNAAPERVTAFRLSFMNYPHARKSSPDEGVNNAGKDEHAEQKEREEKEAADLFPSLHALYADFSAALDASASQQGNDPTFQRVVGWCAKFVGDGPARVDGLERKGVAKMFLLLKAHHDYVAPGNACDVQALWTSVSQLGCLGWRKEEQALVQALLLPLDHMPGFAHRRRDRHRMALALGGDDPEAQQVVHQLVNMAGLVIALGQPVSFMFALLFSPQSLVGSYLPGSTGLRAKLMVRPRWVRLDRMHAACDRDGPVVHASPSGMSPRGSAFWAFCTFGALALHSAVNAQAAAALHGKVLGKQAVDQLVGHDGSFLHGETKSVRVCNLCTHRTLVAFHHLRRVDDGGEGGSVAERTALFVNRLLERFARARADAVHFMPPYIRTQAQLEDQEREFVGAVLRPTEASREACAERLARSQHLSDFQREVSAFAKRQPRRPTLQDLLDQCAARANDPALCVLSEVVTTVSGLERLQSARGMARLYRMLHTQLMGLVPVDRHRQPLNAAVHELASKCETREDVLRVLGTMAQGVEAFNGYHESVGGQLDVGPFLCADKDKSPLANFVTIPDGSEGADVLWSALRSCVEPHNSLLRICQRTAGREEEAEEEEEHGGEEEEERQGEEEEEGGEEGEDGPKRDKAAEKARLAALLGDLDLGRTVPLSQLCRGHGRVPPCLLDITRDELERMALLFAFVEHSVQSGNAVVRFDLHGLQQLVVQRLLRSACQVDLEGQHDEFVFKSVDGESPFLPGGDGPAAECLCPDLPRAFCGALSPLERAALDRRLDVAIEEHGGELEVEGGAVAERCVGGELVHERMVDLVRWIAELSWRAAREVGESEERVDELAKTTVKAFAERAMPNSLHPWVPALVEDCSVTVAQLKGVHAACTERLHRDDHLLSHLPRLLLGKLGEGAQAGMDVALQELMQAHANTRKEAEALKAEVEAVLRVLDRTTPDVHHRPHQPLRTTIARSRAYQGVALHNRVLDALGLGSGQETVLSGQLRGTNLGPVQRRLLAFARELCQALWRLAGQEDKQRWVEAGGVVPCDLLGDGGRDALPQGKRDERKGRAGGGLELDKAHIARSLPQGEVLGRIQFRRRVAPAPPACAEPLSTDWLQAKKATVRFHGKDEQLCTKPERVEAKCAEKLGVGAGEVVLTDAVGLVFGPRDPGPEPDAIVAAERSACVAVEVVLPSAQSPTPWPCVFLASCTVGNLLSAVARRFPALATSVVAHDVHGRVFLASTLLRDVRGEGDDDDGPVVVRVRRVEELVEVVVVDESVRVRLLPGNLVLAEAVAAVDKLGIRSRVDGLQDTSVRLWPPPSWPPDQGDEVVAVLVSVLGVASVRVETVSGCIAETLPSATLVSTLVGALSGGTDFGECVVHCASARANMAPWMRLDHLSPGAAELELEMLEPNRPTTVAVTYPGSQRDVVHLWFGQAASVNVESVMTRMALVPDYFALYDEGSQCVLALHASMVRYWGGFRRVGACRRAQFPSVRVARGGGERGEEAPLELYVLPDTTVAHIAKEVPFLRGGGLDVLLTCDGVCLPDSMCVAGLPDPIDPLPSSTAVWSMEVEFGEGGERGETVRVNAVTTALFGAVCAHAMALSGRAGAPPHALFLNGQPLDNAHSVGSLAARLHQRSDEPMAVQALPSHRAQQEPQPHEHQEERGQEQSCRVVADGGGEGLVELEVHVGAQVLGLEVAGDAELGVVMREQLGLDPAQWMVLDPEGVEQDPEFSVDDLEQLVVHIQQRLPA